MTALKRRLAQFCLILAGCVMALLCAEGLVRLFDPHARDYVIPGGLFDIDGDLGWKLQAGKTATHHSRYFDVVYQINAQGYRDQPRHLSKDENRYRILLYGDSQIFGWGVPAAQRFSNLVEEQQPSLEVWNLAVPGYGVDQQILSYETRGQSFDPDEVIFFLSTMTLRRTHYDRMYKKPKPKFVIDQHGVLRLVPIPRERQAWTSLLYRVLSPLYLPYFVERRLTILQAALQSSRREPQQAIETEKMRIGAVEEKILGRARNVALERQHRLTVIALLPEAETKAWQRVCRQLGIELFAIGFDDDIRGLIHGPYDTHWNAQAHRLIAEQLLSWLQTRSD